MTTAPETAISRRADKGAAEELTFLYMNRNKRSLTLDLQAPPGRQLFLRLLNSVDILAENFRPSVMEKLGLGWEKHSVVNPGLIYCSISGFGYDGASREKGGFDLIAQAVGRSCT